MTPGYGPEAEPRRSHTHPASRGRRLAFPMDKEHAMTAATPTTHEEFYRLYLSRVHTVVPGASSEQVAASPAALAIREWPPKVLERTAPDALPHTIEGLNPVLRRWEERLEAAGETRARATRRSREGRQGPRSGWLHAAPRRRHHRATVPHPLYAGHSLAYWNGSPNGGLRRWG